MWNCQAVRVKNKKLFCWFEFNYLMFFIEKNLTVLDWPEQHFSWHLRDLMIGLINNESHYHFQADLYNLMIK